VNRGLARVLRAAVPVALCLSAVVQAQPLHEYAYEPDRIYQVRTGLGITTQIELSPHEEILDYSTGFSAGWDLNRRDNVFYLKPRDVDVDTNLLIRTAAHTYVLELKVVATDWRALEQAKAAGVQYRIRFTYPGDTAFAAAEAPVEEAYELDTRLQRGRAYHFDYDVAYRRKGPGWLVPATVYDDRQFTYIRMGERTRFPSGNFPAVFGRQRENGDEFIVNTTVEGDTIVVHGTYPYLVLRHGDDVVGLRRRTGR
jgi:type IV secretion system protein VirB9